MLQAFVQSYFTSEGKLARKQAEQIKRGEKELRQVFLRPLAQSTFETLARWYNNGRIDMLEKLEQTTHHSFEQVGGTEDRESISTATRGKRERIRVFLVISRGHDFVHFAVTLALTCKNVPEANSTT